MTGVQRACLIGTVIWLFSHGPLVALLSLHQHRAPALSLLALTVVLIVSAVAVRPLLGRPLDLSTRAALGMALVVPLSGLAVTPFLDESLWRTYGDYWPGLTQIVVAALVMRRQWLPGLIAELASAAVLGVLVAGSDLPDRAVVFAALNQPAIVWFTASVGVRFVFDRTARDVARYDADTGRAIAAQASTQARDASARARREDLEHGVVPLLRRVAMTRPGAPTWSLLSRGALVLERQLRDDLRARELLDDTVRAGLREARARGCTVDVVDDRGTGVEDRPEFVAAVRAVLAPALRVCTDARVTLRLTPGGRHATLSVDGSAADADAVATSLRAAELRGTPLTVETEVDLLDGAGSLWADLRPPR
ncbi:hypothetical protein OG218_06925 [Kineococcus sp. NBC_00420]|uniref:hypothetical protein n=1 Tax=unclassified Kineococcus TaxID=2621656 RepID=UPI002E1E63C8